MDGCLGSRHDKTAWEAGMSIAREAGMIRLLGKPACHNKSDPKLRLSGSLAFSASCSRVPQNERRPPRSGGPCRRVISLLRRRV